MHWKPVNDFHHLFEKSRHTFHYTFVLFVKSILTSSPHSVTVTTFPDISIRLSVLLDTSRLDLVVRRDMSSTLLHTPITSVKGYTKQRAFVFLFRILVIHSLQRSYKYLLNTFNHYKTSWCYLAGRREVTQKAISIERITSQLLITASLYLWQQVLIFLP